MDEEIILDHDLTRKWSETMSYMVYKHPGFRHLFIRLLTNNRGKYGAVLTRKIWIAATDAKNIMVNPDNFFPLPIPQRVFALGHEIAHNMFGDVEFRWRCLQNKVVPTVARGNLPFIDACFQAAADYRINALLKKGFVGQPIPDVYLDEAISTGEEPLTEVYAKIFDRFNQPGGGSGGDGDGRQGSGYGEDMLDPGQSTGQDPNKAATQRNATQWSVETANAKRLEENCPSRGSMPGGLRRMFEQLLEPEVPWTEHIKGLARRVTGSGTYSWRRPDRRHIIRDLYMPSRSGFRAGKIAVWCDTSGSMGDTRLNRCVAELSGVLEELKPKLVQVYWCDAKIHRCDDIVDTDELKDCVFKKGIGGGGGTSMLPVLEALTEAYELPELMICFTDGQVHIPAKAPAYPVVWATVQRDEYPYGTVVKLPK